VQAVSSTETKISNSKEEAQRMVEKKASLEAEKKDLGKRVGVMEEQVKKAADEEILIQTR
jgi:regulator of replication initiation timing